MKPTKEIYLLAAVCGAMAIAPLSVSAQTSPTATVRTTVETVDRDDDDHDYGWLGLLGLLGLAGLMKKKNDVHLHDTATVRTDTTRR